MERIEPLQLLSLINQDLAEAAWRKMTDTGWANPTFGLGDERIDLADLSGLDEDEEVQGVRVMTITLRNKNDGWDSPENITVYLRHHPEGRWELDVDENTDEATANLLLEAVSQSMALTDEEDTEDTEDTARAYAALLMAAGRVGED